MELVHYISPQPLSLDLIKNIIDQKKQLILSDESRSLISRSFDYVQDKISDGETLYYGINTGFGSLCDVPISNDEIEQLQLNLLQSHACGMGDEVPLPIVKIMMLLKSPAITH